MVFISHSSKDKAIATAICSHLESAKIECWIAPRDIEAGTDWTTGIMRGIAACRILVVVFSAYANGSEHVGREVAQAFSMGLAVIPFRVEAVVPRESLAYFLATVQWLDATMPPLQNHLGSLTERVRRLLTEDDRSAAAAEVTPETKTQSTQSAPSKRSARIAAVALGVAVITISAAVWFFTAQDRAPHQTNPGAPVAAISPKSIAVLPFENIGANKDDAYFADGVQDEILNNLAKIAQLKVISRTSVMQYRADTKRNLRGAARPGRRGRQPSVGARSESCRGSPGFRAAPLLLLSGQRTGSSTASHRQARFTEQCRRDLAGGLHGSAARQLGKGD